MHKLFPLFIVLIFLSACLQDPVKLEENFSKINSFWANSSAASLSDVIPVKSLESKYPASKLSSIEKNLKDFNQSLSQYSSENAKILSEWLSINLSLADYLKNELKFRNDAKKVLESLSGIDVNSMFEENCFAGFSGISEESDALILKAEEINSRFKIFVSSTALFKQKDYLIDSSKISHLNELLSTANSDFLQFCKYNSEISSVVNTAESEEEICNNLNSFEKEVLALQSMKSSISSIIENEVFDENSSGELASAYSAFEDQVTEFEKLYASLKYACNPQENNG